MNIKSLVKKRREIKKRYKTVEFTEAVDYGMRINKMYQRFPRREAEKLILENMQKEAQVKLFRMVAR